MKFAIESRKAMETEEAQLTLTRMELKKDSESVKAEQPKRKANDSSCCIC